MAGHTLRGRLDEHSNLRLVPRGDGTALANHPFNYTEAPVKYTALEIKGTRTLGKVLAYGLSRFFTDDDLGVPAPADLIGATITLFCNLLKFKEFIKGGTLSACLTSACYNMCAREIQNMTQADALVAEDLRTQHFLEGMGEEARASYDRDRLLQGVICGVIILGIGKNINAEGYRGWATNRVKTFTGTLGLRIADTIWTDDRLPSEESMDMLHGILSSCRPLRSFLFSACVSASKTSGRFMNLWRCIRQLLQGTEMTHIMLIDRFLYNKYPELLFIRTLYQEKGPMTQVWNFLASLPPENRFFCKLIYSQEETNALNRNNMELYTAAAIAAAQFESTSFKYYVNPDNVRANAIKSIVTEYLTIRQDSAMMGIVYAPSAHLGPEERAEVLRLIEIQRASTEKDDIQRGADDPPPAFPKA